MQRKARSAGLMATLLILTLGSSALDAAPFGLTVDRYTNDLLWVDLSNGTRQEIVGPTGLEAPIISLASSVDRSVLYGVQVQGVNTNATTRLVSIDPATGAASVIGSLGGSSVRGLAFDGAGRLYTADGSTLYEVDPATAAKVPVLELGNDARTLVSIGGELYGIQASFGFWCELVRLQPDLGLTSVELPEIPCGEMAHASTDTLWVAWVFSLVLGEYDVEVHEVDLDTGAFEWISPTWWFPYGGNSLVFPGGLAGARGVASPAVEVPTLDAAALALLALALAVSGLVLARRAS